MKSFFNLILIVGVAFTTACSSDSESKNSIADKKGTSDGGGGIISNSSPEDIRAAIQKSREFFKNSLVKGYLHSYMPKEDRLQVKPNSEYMLMVCFKETCTNDGKTIKKGEQVLIKQESTEPSDMLFCVFENLSCSFTNFDYEAYQKDLADGKSNLSYESYLVLTEFNDKDLAEYIDLIKVNLNEDGPCTYHDDKESDASVSKFIRDAEVCFSLKTLQRIPKASLNKHITALWAHELAHLNGFDEVLAQKLEAAIIEIYDAVTDPRMSLKETEKLQMEQLFEVVSNLTCMEEQLNAVAADATAVTSKFHVCLGAGSTYIDLFNRVMQSQYYKYKVLNTDLKENPWSDLYFKTIDVETAFSKIERLSYNSEFDAENIRLLLEETLPMAKDVLMTFENLSGLKQ